MHARSFVSTHLLIVCTVTLLGCGSDANTSGSTLITVAEGGTVQIAGEETRVVFPANAFAADTEVTIRIAQLSEYGALENGRARVLAFEPDGVLLTAPASITLDPGQPAIDATAQLSIRQYSDGGWYPPEISGAQLGSGGVVNASIGMLLPLAIVAQAGPAGSVSGTVIHIYTEEPLAGISFELRAGAEVVDTATSDSAGTFEFAGVPVGSYTVHANVDAANNCYGDPVDKDAAVTADQTTNVFFGFVPGPC